MIPYGAIGKSSDVIYVVGFRSWPEVCAASLSKLLRS